MGNVEPKALVESLANTTSRDFTTHWSMCKQSQFSRGTVRGNVEAMTVVDTLDDVEAEALVDTMADRLLETG